MSILDAVNVMLRYIGELPVPTGVNIDDLSPDHEARRAKEILLETSTELQYDGLWFNKEEWDFVPDNNGNIAIPFNVLSIEGTSQNVIQKDNQLYDLDNKTYIFDTTVTCNVVWDIPFDDLPQVMSSFVLYTASQKFQIYLQGDTATDKDLKEKIATFTLKVEKANMAKNNYNLVRGTRLIDRGSNPSSIA